VIEDRHTEDWFDLVVEPLKAQYEPFRDEIVEAINRVLDRGLFILGPEVEAFEHEVAEYLGVVDAIGVSNCTEGMVIVLDALGIGAGDEVICPAYTFFATAQAIARRGATPVFCDINPVTLNLDPDDVARCVSARTKAIIAVHLCGRPAPLTELPQGIPIVEDAAQAFGATKNDKRVGSLGVAGCFSFFPSKNLFSFGDGGLVTTNDPELASRVRLLRRHGTPDLRRYEAVGYNARLDALHAAVLRVFLPHIEAANAARRAVAMRYADLGLNEIAEPPADEPGHVYHLYPLRCERDVAVSVIRGLEAAGFKCSTLFPTPFHLEPVFAHLGYRPGSLPETERASGEVVSLPIWPGMRSEIQDAIVAGALAGA
jgi:dTDP-4-amino-4,6-dideoxygalactose transaminase